LLSIVEISAADYVDRGYVTENRRPYELRFNNMISAFSMEAIALLIFSGAYFGYLPSQYAKPGTSKEVAFHPSKSTFGPPSA
jgi:hypothetical protein